MLDSSPQDPHHLLDLEVLRARSSLHQVGGEGEWQAHEAQHGRRVPHLGGHTDSSAAGEELGQDDGPSCGARPGSA
eukprot:700707-Hanusia_phi.AAC.1